MKLYVILVVFIVFAVSVEVKVLKSYERIQSKKLITVKQLTSNKHHKQNRHHDRHRKNVHARKRHRRLACICIRRSHALSSPPMPTTALYAPLLVVPPVDAQMLNIPIANPNKINVIPPNVTDGSQPIIVIPPVTTTSATPGRGTTTLGPGKYQIYKFTRVWDTIRTRR